MIRIPSLRSFLGLAYALTWGLLGPWFYMFNIVYQQEIPGWVWILAPLAFIGGWGPSVAAVIVTARAGGRPALRQLFRAVTIWRVSAPWYLVTFLLPPALTAASLAIVDGGLATLGRFNALAALAGAPMAYLMALPFGPLGEELGWRGFALPRLLDRFGPARSALLLGAIWTVWHLPMMLWSPGASMPSFMPLSPMSIAVYAVQITAISVMMTVLFLKTKGSVLLAILAHLAFNTAEAVLYGGLPSLVVDERRAVYLVNVALLGVPGSAGLIWLATRERRTRCPE